VITFGDVVCIERALESEELILIIAGVVVRPLLTEEGNGVTEQKNNRYQKNDEFHRNSLGDPSRWVNGAG
jgi:hypothetical protein